MKEKKLFIAMIALCAVIIVGWVYVGVIAPYIACRRAEKAIEAVKLPEDTEVFFRTKAEQSDVNWEHVRGEKVVFCDKGTEYVRLFVEENNEPDKLKYIHVWSMDTVDDMSIYGYDRMGSSPVDKETQKKMLFDGIDKYVKILDEEVELKTKEIMTV